MESQSFLKFIPSTDRNNVFKGCSQIDVETCDPVKVDIDLIKFGDSIEIPDGTKLTIDRRGDNVAVFKVCIMICLLRGSVTILYLEKRS